ncbi:hypothetical protein [Candidatus Nitrospira bockiana]
MWWGLTMIGATLFILVLMGKNGLLKGRLAVLERENARLKGRVEQLERESGSGRCPMARYDTVKVHLN